VVGLTKNQIINTNWKYNFNCQTNTNSNVSILPIYRIKNIFMLSNVLNYIIFTLMLFLNSSKILNQKTKVREKKLYIYLLSYHNLIHGLIYRIFDRKSSIITRIQQHPYINIKNPIQKNLLFQYFRVTSKYISIYVPISTALNKLLKLINPNLPTIIRPPGVEFYGVERIDISNKKYLLYAGRLEPFKGIFEILNIFQNLILIDDKMTFKIIGRGSLKNRIERYIVKHNLQNNVELIDWLPKKKILEYYKNAWANILYNTKFEGFGRTIIEAAQCGTFSIVSNKGGMTDFVKNLKNGIVITQSNIRELQNIIYNLYIDHELREKLEGNLTRSLNVYFKSLTSINHIIMKHL